jgi:hypothetical protein
MGWHPHPRTPLAGLRRKGERSSIPACAQLVP